MGERTGWQGDQLEPGVSGTERVAFSIFRNADPKLASVMPGLLVPVRQPGAAMARKRREQVLRCGLDAKHRKRIRIMPLNRLCLAEFLRQKVNTCRCQVHRRLIGFRLSLTAGIRRVVADPDNTLGIAPGVVGLPLAGADKAILGELIAIRVVFFGEFARDPAVTDLALLIYPGEVAVVLVDRSTTHLAPRQ